MRCEYCDNLKPIWGAEGYFQIGKRHLIKSDGSVIDTYFFRFSATGELFSNVVDISDHINISYCPMCGRKLVTA